MGVGGDGGGKSKGAAQSARRDGMGARMDEWVDALLGKKKARGGRGGQRRARPGAEKVGPSERKGRGVWGVGGGIVASVLVRAYEAGRGASMEACRVVAPARRAAA